MVNQRYCKQFMIVGSSQSLQYGMYGLVSDEWVFHADKTISFQVPVVLRSCTIFNADDRYATSYSVSISGCQVARQFNFFYPPFLF